ncbi:MULTISPECIES: hypothetical protein [unclassified Bacillus cereus group]|uniref:hypothetical protein n=1 Tax=unclassified Bacillus cereus group TaxID=2750818 RepID=UPI001F56D653
MTGATQKIEELEEKYYKADRRADNAELQFSLLEKEGRLVLFNLENGHEPKGQKECEQWFFYLGRE